MRYGGGTGRSDADAWLDHGISLPQSGQGDLSENDRVGFRHQEIDSDNDPAAYGEKGVYQT